jgi:hypothetical protein
MKQFRPVVLTLPGIENDRGERHSANASSLIRTIIACSSNKHDSSPVHPLNAEPSITSTDAGIVIHVSDSQSHNAEGPILFNFESL